MDRRADAIAPTIRLATKADAYGIAAVHVHTWQVAYRGLMDDAFLDGLSVDDRETRWRRNLPELPPTLQPGVVPRCLWVAVADAATVGFCSVGPSRDPGAIEPEVYAMYVHPSHWRCGLGRRLMALAEDAAMFAASTSLSLWTLRDNPRARAFYEGLGYAMDGGAHEDAVGGVTLAHVRYRKALRPTAPG